MEEKVAQHAVELDRLRKQLESLPHFHQCSLSVNEHLKEMRSAPLALKFTIYEECRKIGQSLFNEGKFKEALGRYEDALSLFRWMENVNSSTPAKLCLELKGEEPTQEVAKRLTVCYLNIAICNLKLENYKEADYACDAVLALDPENAKAKYRKAVAITSSRGSGLEDLRTAIKLLREAVSADPANAHIKGKLGELVETLRTQEAKSKNVYKSMLSMRAYEDMQPVTEVLPKNRVQDLDSFIDRIEMTLRQLEADGNYSEAESLRPTLANARKSRDELVQSLGNLEAFKESRGVTLLDALRPTDRERGSLLPSVPKVAGEKKWDWLFVPAVVCISIVTVVSYLLERQLG